MKKMLFVSTLVGVALVGCTLSMEHPDSGQGSLKSDEADAAVTSDPGHDASAAPPYEADASAGYQGSADASVGACDPSSDAGVWGVNDASAWVNDDAGVGVADASAHARR